MITNILSYLDAMAQRFPDKTAIADEKTFLTFAEWKYQAEVIGTALGIATLRACPEDAYRRGY